MSFTMEDSFATPRMLSTSISSLSSSRQQASQIAKAYRQAAQLFLTRRLPEAYSTIEPVITPQHSDQINGDDEEHTATPAPVAAASRGTRVKVWSFYLTFLNAVIEMGPEEGKHAFGSTRWKAMVAKCRDGSIWEEIVKLGYGGSEGEVDADVVINLVTLLLTHAPTQRLTQQRMETYLSASAHPQFDISSHMANIASPRRRGGSVTNGTNTPRDLNSKLKLLELYTLHILPRNEEWDYAKSFIEMSELLDDERREAFLITLHNIREEKEFLIQREAELAKEQQEQAEQRRREAEAKRREALKEEEERKHREALARQPKPRSPETEPSDPSRPRHPQTPTRKQTASTHPRASKPVRKPPLPPPGIYQRASHVMTSLHTMIINTGRSLTNNPMALLRALLFFVALVLAVGRRDLRERIKRILARAWDKTKRTVGMGVKVSYI